MIRSLKTMVVVSLVLLPLSVMAGTWTPAGRYTTEKDDDSTNSLWWKAGYKGSGAKGMHGEFYYAKGDYESKGGEDPIGDDLECGGSVEALNELEAAWFWFETTAHGLLKTDYKTDQYTTGQGHVAVEEGSSYSETVNLTVPEVYAKPTAIPPIDKATEFSQRTAELSATGSEESGASDTYSLPYTRYTMERTGLVVPPQMNHIYVEYKLLNKIVFGGMGRYEEYGSFASFTNNNGYLAYAKIRKPYL